jgi:predicted TIM-barrel fold metal-dependent hydrolase
MTDHSGLIDVHAHFTTDRYIELAKAAGHRQADGMPEAYWPRWSVEGQLALMDEAGIASALLSVSSPGVHFGDDAAARLLAREVNENAAEAARQHPHRLGFLAALPLPDVDGSLAEIAYAFDELKTPGVILLSNSAGQYLGDKRLDPVLAELDRRGAVVLLHPTSCVGQENLACGRPVAMIEFLFDTARTVVDLVISGAVNRYPNLRIIVPHAGGVLPLLADRVDLFRSIGVVPGENDQESIRTALARFYYDLAGTPTRSQLDALRTISPPDRLLYGSDSAWTRDAQVLRTIGILDTATGPRGESWRRTTTRNAQQLLSKASLPR